MPAAIPVIATAFVAVGSAGAAVLGTAAAAALASTAFTIGAVAVTWGAVAIGAGIALMAASVLMQKAPKPSSSGQQLDTKIDPKAPVPIAFGRTATGGYLVYRNTWGEKNKYAGLATVLSAGGPIEAIERYYANEYLLSFDHNPLGQVGVVTGTLPSTKKLFKKKLWARYLLGETPAAQTLSAAMGDQGPLPGAPGRLSGLATVITRSEYDQDAFPQGLAKSLWVVRGVKMYDPRKDSTYPGGSGSHRRDNKTTWEWSENPFIAALHWTLGRFENSKKVYGIGARWEEIDASAYVHGANVADANSWTIGGVVTTADDKFAVLASILATGGGVPVARGAQISCVVNAPIPTITTITPADVIGEISIQNTTSLRDRHNTTIPSYREETQFWNVIQGEVVSADTYVQEDNGEVKSQAVEYTLCQSAKQAHQLAAYELANSREFLTFSIVGKTRLLDVKVGEAVVVDIAEIAADAIKCMVVNREVNPSDLTVTLSLKSENDAKHAFALGQSQVAPPSISLRGYDPADPDAPGETAWSITGTSISANGHTVPVLIVSGENDNPYTASIIVEYRPLGSSAWIVWGEMSRTSLRAEISTVTTGTSYEVAISYRTIVGALSDRLILGPATAGAVGIDWTNIGDATGTRPVDVRDPSSPFGNSGQTVGQIIDAVKSMGNDPVFDTTPPAVPTGLTLTTRLDGTVTKVVATWTANTESDLAGYELLIAENGGNEVSFPSSVASYALTARPNIAYTVRVRAYDQSGNRSTYCPRQSITAARDTVAPAPPTGFVVDSLGLSGLALSWVNAPDADLATVAVYVSDTTDPATANLAATVNALPSQRGGYQASGLASGATSSYWIASRDTSGNESARTGPVTATVPDVTAADLADNAVVARTIAAGAIATRHMSADSIDGTVIRAGSLSADKINSTSSLPASLTIGQTGFSLSTIASNSAGGYGNGSNRLPFSGFEAGPNDGGWLAPAYNPAGIATGASSSVYNGKSINRVDFRATASAATDNKQQVSIESRNDTPQYWATVTPGERIYVGALIGTSNCAVYGYVIFSAADGSSESSVSLPSPFDPGVFPAGAADWTPWRCGLFATVPAGCTKARLRFYGLAKGAGTGFITIAEPTIAGVSATQTTPPVYSPGPINTNVASVVNAGTTRIDPGKIMVSGNTSLADWRYGGDNTSINGGAIAANTISANKLTIGVRGVQVLDIAFDTDRVNTVRWSAGFVEWIDDNNNRRVDYMRADSAGYDLNNPVAVVWVWFDRSASPNYYGDGTGHLFSGMPAGGAAEILRNPNNVIVANYRNGTNMVVYNGRTIIDGDVIKTGTVYGDRIIANTLDGGAIRAGSLYADRIQANTIDANQIRLRGVTWDSMDIANLSRERSAAWADNNGMTPGSGQTYTVPVSFALGDIRPSGVFSVQSVIDLVTNVGTQTQTSYNGKPLYTNYIEAGGGLSVGFWDNEGHWYSMRDSGIQTVLATRDFSPTLAASVTKGNYDSGIRNQGDYYDRDMAATYTVRRINVTCRWSAI